MKLLNCVISFNRFYYLRNTVESFRQFCKTGDLMVIDNGSDDPETLKYLTQIQAQGVEVVRRRKIGEAGPPDDDRIPLTEDEGRLFPGSSIDRPGLVTGTEMAVKFGLARGYDYVNLMPDDVQFMWHDPDLLDRIHLVFTRAQDISSLSLFFQLRINASVTAALEPIPAVRCYRNNAISVTDMGIISMNKVREHGFRFVESPEGYRYWLDRGFRSYWLGSPVLAWIPWVSTFRDGRRTGAYLPSPGDWYLEPLDSGQIASMLGVECKSIPFLEDYCRPSGWACLKPYWATRWNEDDYLTNLLSLWWRRRFEVPVFAGNGRKSFSVPDFWPFYLRLPWSLARLMTLKLLRRVRSAR